MTELPNVEKHTFQVIDSDGNIYWKEIPEIQKDFTDENGVIRVPEGITIENKDNVNHPSHYCSHPSGVECIEVTELMSFNLGNAIKYIWRADLKGKQIEDLKKAAFYIEREIRRIENGT